MPTTRTMIWCVLVLACAITGLAGCDAASRDDGDDDAADDDGTTTDGTSSETGDDTDTLSDGCAEETKKVYAIDADRALYRFDPPAKTFELVGTLSCASGGQPFSMAVARDGTAYVLFWNQANCVALNRVSTLDASCLGETEFQCGEDGFGTFGMGFATDGPGSTEETLFIGKSQAPYKLGTVDLETFAVTPVGTLTNAPEMTGNSLGELWAFFAWATPPKVAQIDKTTGLETNVMTFDQLAGNAAFAFAHWGGDYYLFHAPNAANTTVYRLSDGVLEPWVQDTGFVIVGAGVSTCAPVDVE